MILSGAAGSGKSFVIHTLVNEIVVRANEKYPEMNGMARVLLLAPTGRAALNIDGATLQSKDGLRCPITNMSILNKIRCVMALRCNHCSKTLNMWLR